MRGEIKLKTNVKNFKLLNSRRRIISPFHSLYSHSNANSPSKSSLFSQNSLNFISKRFFLTQKLTNTFPMRYLHLNEGKIPFSCVMRNIKKKKNCLNGFHINYDYFYRYFTTQIENSEKIKELKEKGTKLFEMNDKKAFFNFLEENKQLIIGIKEIEAHILIQTITKGEKEFLEMLINKGINIFIKFKGEINLLHISTLHAKEEQIKLLLAKGININEGDKWGVNSLMRSAVSGNKKIAQLLLDNGADIHSIDQEGRNSLIFSAMENRMEILSFLLEKGADINSKDKGGRSPLIYAMKNIKMIDFLLKKGADIEIKDKKQFTPLIYACSNGFVEIADLLLSNGANVNYQIEGTLYTPLMIAVQNGNKDLFSLLLKNGADPSLKGQNEIDCMIIALSKKNFEIVDLLVRVN